MLQTKPLSFLDAATDGALRVGAKFLASMALPNFCERCLYYRVKCGDAPFSIFPSIFNAIDLYTKSIVHTHIDETGRAPKWMGSFAEATGYKNVGFLKHEDEKNELLLKGSPDVVLHDAKEIRCFVGDYKTARYDDGRDHLLPQYKVQVLAYAYLLVMNGYKKPERAALFYFEPPTDLKPADLLKHTTKTGFTMPFSVKVVDLELADFEEVEKLMKRMREIYDQQEVPNGREGCRDCMRLDRYIRQSEKDSRPAKAITGVDTVLDRKGKKRHLARWVEKGDDFKILAEDTGEWFPDWKP